MSHWQFWLLMTSCWFNGIPGLASMWDEWPMYIGLVMTGFCAVMLFVSLF